MSLSRRRAAGLVLLAAVAAYANSLGNGFAYDDSWVVAGNPLVTESRLADVADAPYWPRAVPGTGNYRPLTVLSWAVEWPLWGGSPLGFHAVNVAAHAAVSVLVFVLLAAWTGAVGGLVGGLVFAVHPVHVEAVANVVGRSELYAALFVLGAVLLYRRTVVGGPGRRAAGVAGVAALYALGLASKEMAVTLPGLLVALELLGRVDPAAGSAPGPGAPPHRTPSPPLRTRLARLAPHVVALSAVLATYLVVRHDVLGVLTGESPAAGLRGLSARERLFTALTVWPQYLRLMLFPLDLSMDYQPAVLPVARTFTVASAVGAVILGVLLTSVVALRRRHPDVSTGLAWFLVTVLPVSNLLVRSDVLLAERTLYLPSVGVALVAAAAAVGVARSHRTDVRRWALVAGAVAGVALMVRTVTRNPTWVDTFTAVATLAREHPESYVSVRSRAQGLERVGDLEEAGRLYEMTVAMVPDDYTLVMGLGDHYARRGQVDRALDLYRRAVRMTPNHPAAYQRLGVEQIKAGRVDDAHAALVEGLRMTAFPDRQLWSLLSETYIARGDLPAALRARRAALGVDEQSREDWRRLADLLEALGRSEEAREARRREAAAPPEDPARRPVEIS